MMVIFVTLNGEVPMGNRRGVKTLLALMGTLGVWACSGQTDGFSGKSVDVRREQKKSAAAASAETTLEPALMPQNVAGANLTMDCFPVDAIRGDGLTNFECLLMMAQNKVYSGEIKVSDAALETASGEKSFSTRVDTSSKGTFQAVFFEKMKVQEIPGVTGLNVDGMLGTVPFSGKYTVADSAFATAKTLDNLDPTPNLAQCGKGKPEIVSLSSNSGRCAQGGVMVFWSPKSKRMACCQLKDPSLMLSLEPTSRSLDCRDDEFVVGFSDHSSRTVKCGKLDTNRVEVSSGVRVPALVNFGGITGLAASFYTRTSAEVYEAAAEMLRAFGSSEAMGCKDEYMIRGLAPVGGSTFFGSVIDAFTSMPDVLPRCRTIESKVKY
jgi:hypothetical protein